VLLRAGGIIWATRLGVYNPVQFVVYFSLHLNASNDVYWAAFLDDFHLQYDVLYVQHDV
jgi:hypothetical protein